jgi:hypothetical protein
MSEPAIISGEVARQLTEAARDILYDLYRDMDDDTQDAYGKQITEVLEYLDKAIAAR